jgi:hypothetical protein
MLPMASFIFQIANSIFWLFFNHPHLSPSPTSRGLLYDIGLAINVALGRDVGVNGLRRFLDLLPSALSGRLISTTCGQNL